MLRSSSSEASGRSEPLRRGAGARAALARAARRIASLVVASLSDGCVLALTPRADDRIAASDAHSP